MVDISHSAKIAKSSRGDLCVLYLQPRSLPGHLVDVCRDQR
jgi:hypothetical protein